MKIEEWIRIQKELLKNGILLRIIVYPEGNICGLLEQGFLDTKGLKKVLKYGLKIDLVNDGFRVLSEVVE